MSLAISASGDISINILYHRRHCDVILLKTKTYGGNKENI